MLTASPSQVGRALRPPLLRDERESTPARPTSMCLRNPREFLDRRFRQVDAVQACVLELRALMATMGPTGQTAVHRRTVSASPRMYSVAAPPRPARSIREYEHARLFYLLPCLAGLRRRLSV